MSPLIHSYLIVWYLYFFIPYTYLCNQNLVTLKLWARFDFRLMERCTRFNFMWSILSVKRAPVMNQELPTLTEHLSSRPVFSGVRVTRSLILYVWFVNRCLFFCPFSFWQLCCLSFFDLRIVITLLVSSNSP